MTSTSRRVKPAGFARVDARGPAWQCDAELSQAPRHHGAERRGTELRADVERLAQPGLGVCLRAGERELAARGDRLEVSTASRPTVLASGVRPADHNAS